MSSDELPPENLKTTPRSKIQSGPLGVARILVNLFSTNENRRDPPFPSTKTHGVRLITINVSHYCEKVRWGLDLLENDISSPLYYTEDAHPPPFCSFATLPASNFSSSATPMIVDSQDVHAPHLNMSDVLLQKYCPFLYPSEIQQEIVNFELEMGKRLGPAVRCYCYHYLLQPQYHDVCVDICSAQTSKIETLLFDKMLEKGISQAMRKIIHVHDSSAASSKEELVQVFDQVSKRLEQHGGTYLMDSPTKSFGLTAADVTFAALAYPLLRPTEMTRFLVEDDSRLPPELVAMGEQLRQTTAGKHVLQMYKLHRIPQHYYVGSNKPKDGLVYIKSAQRNVNPFPKLLYRVGIVGAVVVSTTLWYRRQ